MRKVTLLDILAPEVYAAERERVVAEILAVKAPRRIHLGQYLTFLFENTDTMRFQVQEMVRIEGIRDESAIRYELDTYNELLGEENELGCTLLIEIDDPLQRDVALRKWLDLPAHLYVRLEDGARVGAIYDERQVGSDRLSSVQYLKFACAGQRPVAIGVDLAELNLEVPFSDEQRQALWTDLDVITN